MSATDIFLSFFQTAVVAIPCGWFLMILFSKK